MKFFVWYYFLIYWWFFYGFVSSTFSCVTSSSSCLLTCLLSLGTAKKKKFIHIIKCLSYFTPVVTYNFYLLIVSYCASFIMFNLINIYCVYKICVILFKKISLNNSKEWGQVLSTWGKSKHWAPSLVFMQQLFADPKNVVYEAIVRFRLHPLHTLCHCEVYAIQQ